jgi:hypothetical protein
VGEAGDGRSKNLLVFDFGGGTLDVTIMQIDAGTMNFRVRSTDGDTRLGGEDIDARLVEHFLGVFKEQTSIDLLEMKDSDKRKKALSKLVSRPHARLCVPLHLELSMPYRYSCGALCVPVISLLQAWVAHSLTCKTSQNMRLKEPEVVQQSRRHITACPCFASACALFLTRG